MDKRKLNNELYAYEGFSEARKMNMGKAYCFKDTYMHLYTGSVRSKGGPLCNRDVYESEDAHQPVVSSIP
jgi:hypothetical protein